jgi:hypothetical protein
MLKTSIVEAVPIVACAIKELGISINSCMCSFPPDVAAGSKPPLPAGIAPLNMSIQSQVGKAAG